MEAVRILRQLWCHRLLVAVGLALSIVVLVVMAYRVNGLANFESRQYKVGIASAEVLIDSPSSQVADLGGGQAVTDVTGLASRARLLANLMATSPLKEQIARRAGVDPRRLVATAPSLDLPQKKNALNDVDADGQRATRLTVNFNEVLPIITADAQAPSPQVAARISSAAVTQLKAYLKTVAAADKVPDARQLVIRPLGPARFALVTRGPRRVFAIIAALLVFGLWCAGIVVSTRLARGWREVAAAEDFGPGPAPVPILRPEHPFDPSGRTPAAAAPRVSPPSGLPGGLEKPERPERPRHRDAAA